MDLTHSRAWLQSGGRITYGPVPTTSGRPGYRTYAGTFQVYWKDADHHSSEFDNAPMPNSVFFDGGIAFHAGSLSVPSHGCIHLSNEASQVFFDRLSVGDEVYVFGYAPY
nr:L,D-transpeptidase [Nakamurella endophytica]